MTNLKSFSTVEKADDYIQSYIESHDGQLPKNIYFNSEANRWEFVSNPYQKYLDELFEHIEHRSFLSSFHSSFERNDLISINFNFFSPLKSVEIVFHYFDEEATQSLIEKADFIVRSANTLDFSLSKILDQRYKNFVNELKIFCLLYHPSQIDIDEDFKNQSTFRRPQLIRPIKI